MANPVTHILVPMFILETYRRYFAKKGFSRWYVFLAGFFGGLPDLDLIFSVIVTGEWDTPYHRSTTHTLLIPIALTLIGLAIYYLCNRKILSKGWRASYPVLFIMSIGIATHVLIDGIDGLTQWFYPLAWSIELPNLIYDKFRAGLVDGVLFFAWLLYDEKFLGDILTFLRLKKKR
jgi:hypothetical protein